MRSSEKKSIQSRKLSKKDLKKKSEILIPSFSPEDLVRLGKQYEGLESPIDISFPILTDANLRPLEWVNFERNPKRMKLSNSGTTAILSAKWHGPRPYLTKGPLTGYYVFSQLHFHWGRTSEEGSEHTIDGRSLPLEAHAMFFKNTYLTQEDAMNKTDGTITIAYLFTLQSNDNDDFNPIISAINEIRKPLTSYHLELLPLEKFLHIFTDDYFMYWGNIVNRSILWLICRRPLGISARQLSVFHTLTGINENPIMSNFRMTKELNHRIVYHINPSKYRNDLLFEVLRDSRMRKNRSAGHSGVKSTVGTGDGKPKSARLTRDGSVDKVSENQNDESILINISVHADEKLETFTSRSELDTADEVSSLRSTTSNNAAMNLEKRRKSEIKFQLAAALVNLEKEEGNDYSFLEKYLQMKYETFQAEQFYETPSGEDTRGEAMLRPSVRSLRVNSSEDLVASMVSSLKDKSKSDINCVKFFVTSGEYEKTSIAESRKSAWSSTNSLSEKEEREEKMEDEILPPRPRTPSAKPKNIFSNIIKEGEERMLIPRSSSKLDNLPPSPARSKTFINNAVILWKPSSEKEKTKSEGPRGSRPKTPLSAVDEAREKIRSTLRQSISKLSKLRGASPLSPSKMQKPDSRSSRPAWRY